MGSATDLLASRGLTPAVIDEARGVIASLGKVYPLPEGPTVEEDAAELVRAEDALWGWYLQWTPLARIAIRDRVLLRQMGFAG